MIDVIDVLAVALRAASFVVILQAAGTGLFLVLYRRNLYRSAEAIARFSRRSTIVGIILGLASQALVAARMSGEMSGIADASLQSLSWFSSSGAATVVRVTGLLLIAVALNGHKFVIVLGVLAVDLSFALTGHTATHFARPLLAPILMFHLFVVIFWFGALPALLYSVKHDASTIVLERFSAHATWLVPGLAIAGLLLAYVLLPNFAALNAPYGRALLIKILGFAILMSLAGFNKLRFVPAISRGDRTAKQSLSRSIVAEYSVMVAVLCATATMTTLFSPET